MVNLVAKVKLITKMPFKPTAKQNKMQRLNTEALKTKKSFHKSSVPS